LAVDRHAFAAREAREIDPVAASFETKRDALVEESLALQPLAESRLDQDVTRPLLDDPGPHPVLAVPPALPLEDDRFDPG